MLPAASPSCASIAAGERHACPIGQIDNFAMRNFTADTVFDDTFPAADGVLEAGNRVPIDRFRPPWRTGSVAKATSSRRTA